MTNARRSNRKSVTGLTVSNITALSEFTVISKIGTLMDASSTGFLLHVERKDLIPKLLKTGLDISALEGEFVVIRLKEMDLEIDGTVTRTRHIGRGVFEVAIDFSDEAPEYWRECLVDLLPVDGEIDEP
jgi:hypothetical protein